MKYLKYLYIYYILFSRNQSAAYSKPLPSGWEMRRNEKGRIYFVDHNTKITTWDGKYFIYNK